MTNRLHGVLPVIATPFDDRWKIDRAALEREIDWLYDQRVDGVVVAMVSEILRLSTEERRELHDAVIAANDDRGPVVVSVGAESTVIARELAVHAEASGADAVMITPPMLTRVGEDQLLAHLDAVVERVSIPVIFQDASSYVGDPVSVRLQAELVTSFGADRLLLKPEADPLGQRVSAILEATDGRARIFDGSGGVALFDTFRRGIVGTMPGPDLVWAVRGMWDALTRGDDELAVRISNPLTALISMVPGLDGYVAFEKHMLVRQGVLPDPRMRGPVNFQIDAGTEVMLELQTRALRDAVGAVAV
ncbi:MAG: dapA 3 [Microbacterium sp.]|nr:dapA 3 [Microbacterium sp.]